VELTQSQSMGEKGNAGVERQGGLGNVGIGLLF
jgi:hypothetical protein